MDPPSDSPAPARKFQTRRGVQRTSQADRDAFAQAEERRQAEAQRQAERAAAAASRRTYVPRGRGALRGSSAERIRNENSGGVFGSVVPARGVGARRGRGSGSGRGRDARVEGLVGVKEEVPVEGVGGQGGIGPTGDTEQLEAGGESAEIETGDGDPNTTKSRAKLVTEG